ncbi:hypothetical protein ACFE04_031410 [Oxalis oulophora]
MSPPLPPPNDVTLHLVAPLRTTQTPTIYQLIGEMIATATQLYQSFESQSQPVANSLPSLFSDFILKTTDFTQSEKVGIAHLKMFSLLSAPAAFVMLYSSQEISRKQCVENCVNQLLRATRFMMPIELRIQFTVLVFEFCTLLRNAESNDPLYVKCRNALGLLLLGTGVPREVKDEAEGKGSILVEDIFPFVCELAHELSVELDSGGLFWGKSEIVRDFAHFMIPLRNAIVEELTYSGLFCLPLTEEGYNFPIYKEEIDYLHAIFSVLLEKMDDRLADLEDSLKMEGLLVDMEESFKIDDSPSAVEKSLKIDDHSADVDERLKMDDKPSAAKESFKIDDCPSDVEEIFKMDDNSTSVMEKSSERDDRLADVEESVKIDDSPSVVEESFKMDNRLADVEEESFKMDNRLADVEEDSFEMDNSFTDVDESLSGSEEDSEIPDEWSHYLKILNQLRGISKLFEGAEQKFRDVLKKRKTLISMLVEKCGTTSDDYRLVIVSFDGDDNVAQYAEDFDEEPITEEDEYYGQSFEFEEKIFSDKSGETFVDEVVENFADENGKNIGDEDDVQDGDTSANVDGDTSADENCE